LSHLGETEIKTLLDNAWQRDIQKIPSTMPPEKVKEFGKQVPMQRPGTIMR
jgi:hypothetical protein